MAVRQRSPAEVRHQTVAALGLDPGRFDLTSQEAVAAALRRTAGFLCPCSASSLVRAVVKPLRGLVEDLDVVRSSVEATLEAMVSHGDLLEFRELGVDPAQGRTLLFAAPAAFIPRDSGTQILVGIYGDDLSGVPEDLADRLDHAGHTRRLNPVEGEDFRETLREHGLLEIPYEEWLKAPKFDKPAALISRYNDLLDSARPSGDVPGLRLLDPERPVGYYRGRWVEPQKRSGRFVARRDQAYGAQLWSYVQLTDGKPEALVDLPLPKHRWRGCDEAWHLQMAIDARHGKPQRFAIRVGPDDTRIMAFFSPVPMWARRRWDAVGERIPGERCLFAYRIDNDEVPQELEFIHRALWLDELASGE